MSVVLRCTVRGCMEPLACEDRVWRCPRRHSFDVNRHGVLTLLQPQDKRSKHPGDSKETAEARRRLAALGYLSDVHAAFAHAARGIGSRGGALLDVGCGEGAFLRSLEKISGMERHGLDLSVPAADLAARTTPGVLFVVANADRSLPYTDGQFDVVTSLDSRSNATEFARVLKPEGLALIAVPGPDDLSELRAAVKGAATTKPRGERIDREFGTGFRLADKTTLREVRAFDTAALSDLLRATYRGFRLPEREATRGLTSMSVTSSHEIRAYVRT